MGKHMEEEKKPVFKRFLIIYVIMLVVLMLAFLIYVADSLIKYENNQIDTYMANLMEDLKVASKKGKIEKYIETANIQVSEFEKKSTTISEGYKELLNSQKITYKVQEDGENPIYDIYANEQKILEVTLNGKEKQNRLGLLTFNKWKTEKIENKTENGLYTCNVLVPNNYEVYVNNQKLSQEQIKETVQNEGLAQISKYVEIPYIVKYEIANLLIKPDVKILDKNGNKVEYKQEGNTISKDLNFISASTQEEAIGYLAKEVDALAVAKDWSLYLTDDLEGRLHGYYNISKHLIEGSDIKKFAYSWATGVDITFVSSHTLLNPTFTNEELSDFEIYNDKAFSCEVYLQKNLRLKSGGKKIEDKMNERMYFAYYDDTEDGKENPEWKLVNMQSVADNNK